MTWTRFYATLQALPVIDRIRKGQPMSHAEHIEAQREAKESGL